MYLWMDVKWHSDGDFEKMIWKVYFWEQPLNNAIVKMADTVLQTALLKVNVRSKRAIEVSLYDLLYAFQDLSTSWT